MMINVTFYLLLRSINSKLSFSRDDALTLAGFDNRKKARKRFNTHASSDTHKEAVLKIELSKQGSVHALINKQAMAEQKVR